MKKMIQQAGVLLLFSTLCSRLSTASAQGTAFNLYVANNLPYDSSPSTRYFTVEKFDSLGNASVFATNSSFSNPILSAPVAVAINSSGHVYVDCSQDNTWIEEFDASGNDPGRFVNPTVNFPAGMVFDGSGNLYVANNNSIQVYNPQGQGNVFATTGTAFLEGLAFDAVGNLWVTDEYNGLVEMRNAGGTLTRFAAPGHNPYGLAFDKSGSLYVALAGNGNIVKYDSNTNQTLVAALGSSAQPVGLAFDPAGNLYVTESGSNRIVRIDPQYNVTIFATNGLNGPSFLAIEAVAPSLAITQAGNSAIVSWPSPSTGFLLQTNANLANTNNWINFTGIVVTNGAGTTNSVTISPPVGNLFFRLAKP